MKFLCLVTLLVLTILGSICFAKKKSKDQKFTVKCNISLQGDKAFDLKGESQFSGKPDMPVSGDGINIEFGKTSFFAGIETIREQTGLDFNKNLTIKIYETISPSLTPSKGPGPLKSWRTEIFETSLSGRISRLTGYEFITGIYKGIKYTRVDYSCSVFQ